MRLSASILLCFASIQIVSSQDFAEQQRQIRAAVDRNDQPAALATLENLRRSTPKVFAQNNYDYLSARLSERRGDNASATANYLQVSNRGSELRGYALWHLSQLARSSGDLMLERERLRQLLAAAPGSLLQAAATLRLAKSFFASADWPAAIATLRPLTQSQNANAARQALALTGEALLRSDKRAEAVGIFNALVAQMPDGSRPDDFALAAVRALDALEVESATMLSESDHLRRANVYQFNRDFDGARSHYLTIVEKHPQSSSMADALYQIGRGLYQQARYGEALKYLQRVDHDYVASPSARDALGLQASSYLRLKRNDEAVAAYKQIIDRFPDGPNPERAYLNLIDAFRDAGRDDQALEWIKQTRARFRDQIGGTLALFAQAKIHVVQSRWAAAIADLEELQTATDLGGARVNGGTVPAEVAFLRALTLEQLGRLDEAVAAYLAIPAGRNEYYGFRATQRLRALDADPKSHSLIASRLAALRAEATSDLASNQIEAGRRAAQAGLRLTGDQVARRDLLEVLRRIYDLSPSYRLPPFKLLSLGRQQVLSDESVARVASAARVADELLFLGLYDEGIPELALARAADAASTAASTKSTGSESAQSLAITVPPAAADFDFTMAVYSLRGDLPYPAVRFAESVWRSVPSDYVLELAPRELLELLYPAPYRDALLKEASSRAVDPRFVLSIARQESRFRSDAKSVAAARGLMQFIAATADTVARELKRRDFQQDDLYDPRTAIQFGSQYLRSLFKQFPAQPEAVAASYNGGADNMARWIARSHGNDPGRYVSEIGFSQTKDYVFRVMSNYWVYQELYSDQLQTQTSPGSPNKE